jgi:hypothetical protein
MIAVLVERHVPAPYIDAFQLADVPVSDQFNHKPASGKRSVLSPKLKDAFRFSGDLPQKAGHAEVQRQWLLTVDIFARSRGGDRHWRMPVIVCRNNDSVNVRAFQHFPEISMWFADIATAIMLVYLRRLVFSSALVGIAGSDNSHIVHSRQVPNVVTRDVATANLPNVYSIAWRSNTENRAGNNRWKSQGCAYGNSVLHKISPVDCCFLHVDTFRLLGAKPSAAPGPAHALDSSLSLTD